jgi:hypothetical protein
MKLNMKLNMKLKAKSFILVTTIVCFTGNLLAQSSVLLVSPLVQFEERELPFELSQKYETFSEYYLETHPQQKNVENLLNEFESAQKYYLVKSKELAIQNYEKVISFSDMDDWRDIHRKIIFLSYIRMSELNPENQKTWILKALSFSMDTDPRKLDLDKKTIKKILDLKNSLKQTPGMAQTISWQVGPLKRDFSYILINGHIIDLKKIETVKIPSGKFRLTFLSDIYKPQTLQVSSQQIPLLIPTRIPFVSGNCEKPYVNNEGEILSDISIYYSRDCIKDQIGKKFLVTSPALPNSTPNLLTTAKYKEPIYKKNWFWVAAGILGSVALIYVVHKNDEKKPTHETVSGF